MTILREYCEPNPKEAEENLRVIRELMERSTKYSTFSGISGIFAGIVSIVGCLVTWLQLHGQPSLNSITDRFLCTWATVMLLAISADFLLTKRYAARVGKHIVSHLGKQMMYACLPGLGAGALLTIYLLRHNLLSDVYGIWMLCYGIAVGAVGLFSQREVKFLAVAFLMAGAITLLLPQIGLVMMGLTFGGLHIIYGSWMAHKDGW